MQDVASRMILSSTWSWLIIACAVMLTAIAMIPNAPGEWGRGALLAYCAAMTAYAAGISVHAFGIISIIIPVFCAVSFVVGGPAGLILVAFTAAGTALWQLALGASPFSIFLMPAFAVATILAAIRAQF